MQSTSPKRPQKCMLSGQLEATGGKDWSECGAARSHRHTGAVQHAGPAAAAAAAAARPTVSGGKSGARFVIQAGTNDSRCTQTIRHVNDTYRRTNKQ